MCWKVSLRALNGDSHNAAKWLPRKSNAFGQHAGGSQWLRLALDGWFRTLIMENPIYGWWFGGTMTWWKLHIFLVMNLPWRRLPGYTWSNSLVCATDRTWRNAEFEVESLDMNRIWGDFLQNQYLGEVNPQIGGLHVCLDLYSHGVWIANNMMSTFWPIHPMCWVWPFSLTDSNTAHFIPSWCWCSCSCSQLFPRVSVHSTRVDKTCIHTQWDRDVGFKKVLAEWFGLCHSLSTEGFTDHGISFPGKWWFVHSWTMLLWTLYSGMRTRTEPELCDECYMTLAKSVQDCAILPHFQIDDSKSQALEPTGDAAIKEPIVVRSTHETRWSTGLCKWSKI